MTMAISTITQTIIDGRMLPETTATYCEPVWKLFEGLGSFLMLNDLAISRMDASYSCYQTGKYHLRCEGQDSEGILTGRAFSIVYDPDSRWLSLPNYLLNIYPSDLQGIEVEIEEITPQGLAKTDCRTFFSEEGDDFHTKIQIEDPKGKVQFKHVTKNSGRSHLGRSGWIDVSRPCQAGFSVSTHAYFPFFGKKLLDTIEGTFSPENTTLVYTNEIAPLRKIDFRCLPIENMGESLQVTCHKTVSFQKRYFLFFIDVTPADVNYRYEGRFFPHNLVSNTEDPTVEVDVFKYVRDSAHLLKQHSFFNDKGKVRYESSSHNFTQVLPTDFNWQWLYDMLYESAMACMPQNTSTVTV